jgi:hypothetical protein
MGLVASTPSEGIARLEAFAKMVADLDRCFHGRHEGDACLDCPGQVSRGNPWLQTGEIMGYTISGKPYHMPPRGKRHDPEEWV